MIDLKAKGIPPSRDPKSDERQLISGVVVDGVAQLPECAPTLVRLRARDLGELARAANAVRSDQPGITIVADIDAVIAPRACEAIERWTTRPCTHSAESLSYVGTPDGLVGLIKDLWVLGIVDGALISTSSVFELELVRRSVLPQLSRQTITT
ncbi:hypothetical protein [Mycolicibacterium sp. CBMA 226]|uniref:hypothetical protein n=1 Tax=Mycolicibacterium sp. CBMA 226 TaxID=2606611 RepID=UPI0012DD255E|nr:hypothetical protein [Mycolicibacterium sp. CBMA 226]MUL79034.1 hypothetical protein [Mycolicibacterium sp. CBMA 226]QGW61356.1 hypothetical protein ICEMyc226_00324 [Mycolicibacterium sp.]